MQTKAASPWRPYIEMQFDSLAVASRADPDDSAPESAADIARSEENILQWMAYLPDECIRTMVLMGWDLTT